MSRNVHQLRRVEGPLLVSRENDKVLGHCFDALIVWADSANRAIHANEWRGDSRQDSDAVSDFEIMHMIDSFFWCGTATAASVVSCGFKLIVESDEDTFGTEVHFVLIKHLQVMVICDNADDDPS